MQYNLLDTIQFKFKELIGVADYSSKKFITFYDLTNCDDPVYRLLVIIWRMYGDGIRFSTYCKENFGEVVLPEPLMIPVKGVENVDDMNYPTIHIDKPKSKKINTNRTC